MPTNPEQRFESDVLGDYALGFGKGYFIHGTLYARLLGKNVTQVASACMTTISRRCINCQRSVPQS